MRLTILGATGGVGRQLVAQAVTAGHDVTAVVRSPDTIPPGVRTVRLDLRAGDIPLLEYAVNGADAVLSGLGPRSASEADITWRGTETLVKAMLATGTRRVVVVSASPIGTVPSPSRPNPPKHDPGDGFFMRHLGAPLIKAVFRETYASLARMEDVLRDSALDWTLIRPPRLTDRPLTATYRTAYGQNVRRGLTISRADVAHFMLRALEQPDTVKQAVGIAD